MIKYSSELFKILSVDTRIKIIEMLKAKGPLCVNAIAKSLGVTQSAISQHLRILKSMRLVSTKRKGYWIHYSLDEDVLEDCRQKLNKICTCGCRGIICDVPIRETKGNLERYKIQLEKELRRVLGRLEEVKKI